jgi:hypothetical protein
MGGLKGKRDSDGVCDSCNTDLDPAMGYYLATSNVVLSESYWRNYFANSPMLKMMELMDFNETQRLNAFSEALRFLGGQKSPWSICENCSEFFVFDRDVARSCAIRGTDPPKCGAVDPAEFNLFAAAAWEHVVGRWPANVRQPEVGDSCDLCAKKIYRGEILGYIGREQMQRMRQDGIIDGAPLSPPRPDGDRWAICSLCLGRQLARSHRMRRRPS